MANRFQIMVNRFQWNIQSTVMSMQACWQDLIQPFQACRYRRFYHRCPEAKRPWKPWRSQIGCPTLLRLNLLPPQNNDNTNHGWQCCHFLTHDGMVANHGGLVGELLYHVDIFACCSSDEPLTASYPTLSSSHRAEDASCPKCSAPDSAPAKGGLNHAQLREYVASIRKTLLESLYEYWSIITFPVSAFVRECCMYSNMWVYSSWRYMLYHPICRVIYYV